MHRRHGRLDGQDRHYVGSGAALSLKGGKCSVVRVHREEMNDHYAYTAFPASVELKWHVEVKKTIILAFFTLL